MSADESLADEIVAGKHIRAWREHRGMKLGELAKRAGVAKSYLSQIETGKRLGSARVLAAIAQALRCPEEPTAPWHGWRSDLALSGLTIFMCGAAFGAVAMLVLSGG